MPKRSSVLHQIAERRAADIAAELGERTLREVVREATDRRQTNALMEVATRKTGELPGLRTAT